MPRTCTVCRHVERAFIEQKMIAGESLRNISQMFSLSVAALFRHKAEHLPKTLTKARLAHEITTANNLLDEIQDLQLRALGILEAAEKSGDHRIALSAIREARANLELLAKLLGELKDEKTDVWTGEWQRIRIAVMEALVPFPEVKLSVAEKLLNLELGNESGH